MDKILIVAEKPAQAREYAAALGVRGKGQGYLENDQYLITWCIGHLLELERPEAYMDLERVGRRWSLQRLPVLPAIHHFRHQIKTGTNQQYQILQKLLKSDDISKVICGTDADREGQLLFQEVWDRVGCKKPLARLWISSLTQEAIREGMNKLREAGDVEGLAAAGYGRAYADWDFGMNLTEGFTALFGSFDPVLKKPNVISIGRVQTPTLALIVKREIEIDQFIPENFFEVIANFAAAQGEYRGRWFDPNAENQRLTDRAKAEQIVTKTQGQPGSVVKMEQKKVSEAPPLLFDLTGLTVAASKKFGYSAEKVLELAQSLYEKKAITYPRTDCVYLPDDMIPKLKAHLQALGQEPYRGYVEEALGYGVPSGKRVINTITAHHAIIPTTERIVLAKLSEDERHIYDLIGRRFLAVWFPAAWYQQTEIITQTAGEYFRTKGRILLSSGWKKVYDFDDPQDALSDSTQGTAGKKKTTGKNNTGRNTSDGDEENMTLPPITQGEGVHTKEVRIEEKSTKPPKRYTQGDLLKAMEGAGKHIEDDVLRQQMKGKGLGTVATRPAIIENLIQRGYIRQEQKVLKPTEKGIQLISLIQDKLSEASLLISAEMTGQLEYDLAQVEKGELSLEKYMLEVEEAIVRILNELRDYERKFGKTPLALAPGKSTKSNKTKYSKNQSNVSADNSSSSNSNSNNNKRCSSNSNTNTNSRKQDNTDDKNKVKQEAARNTNKEPAADRLGSCPRCGEEIIEGQKGFGCSNWKNGCSFVVWKTPICGKVLTRTQIKSLLKKGKTPLIKGFLSKTGKPFAAYLIWSDAANGKLKFEFSQE